MTSNICHNFSSGIFINDYVTRVSDVNGASLEVQDLTIRNNYIIYHMINY